ncbi:MAG: hypothetical protein ABSB74_20460 [Tepidisphaeraceae bacterium]
MAHRIEHGSLSIAVHVGQEIVLSSLDPLLIGCRFAYPRPPRRCQIIAEHFGQAVLLR